MDSNVVTRVLFMGKMESFTWNDLGVPVVYDMFQSGTESDIQSSLSGLDPQAREAQYRLKAISHVLRSVGGYNFRESSKEKEEFVRSLTPPVLRLFVSNYLKMRLEQDDAFEKMLEEVKKSQPTHSPESSGSSLSEPQG